MSHLSTIIHRIEKSIDRFDDPMNEASMEKHVKNLKEYPEHWDDATEDEMKARSLLLETKPWQSKVEWTAICTAEPCDFQRTFDTEEQARQRMDHHRGMDEDNVFHDGYVEKDVVEPATMDDLPDTVRD